MAALLGSLLVSGVLVTGCGGKVSDRSIDPITGPELASRVERSSEGLLVLDARSAEAYREGHLPGAYLARLSDIDLNDQTPRWGAYDFIVVYGQDPSSGTAQALVKRLLQTNHKKVALLRGGYDGWVKAGRSTER